MSNLNDALLIGAIADIPSAGVRGRYFFATDEGLMYRDNGSTWVAMPPDAANVTYTPVDVNDWDYLADPGDVEDALDQLAARTTDLEAGGGGGGKLVQVVETQYSAAATGTTAIPLDNTIPQIGEGTQFMSQAITPNSAANYLEVDVKIFLTTSSAHWLIAALFRGATADAKAVDAQYIETATAGTTLKLHYRELAGSTASTTWTVRAGTPSGALTVTFNGQSGVRLFGGAILSTINIKEINP